jgi:hypothetical protein
MFQVNKPLLNMAGAHLACMHLGSAMMNFKYENQ